MRAASVVAGVPVAQVGLVAELEFWFTRQPVVGAESRKYSLKSAAWVPDGAAMVDNRVVVGE